MKTTNKQRLHISELWYYSELKQSESNLALKFTQSGTNEYYTIGKYSFNSITGISHIEPLTGMEKLTYKEIETLLTK